jgi:hypothetical protein
MTTLTSIRTLVRRDLKDEDSANYRWTDNEIDRAVDKALADYSLYCPLQQKSTLATVVSSNELSIASLTDRIDVTRVDHPVTDQPYPSRRFSVWGDLLTFLDGYYGDAGNCYVYWLKRHTLSTTSTIPTPHEHIIALGAAAYAISSQSQYQVDKANTGGQKVDSDYSSWSRDMFTRFYKELESIRTHNTKRLKQSYLTPEE